MTTRKSRSAAAAVVGLMALLLIGGPAYANHHALGSDSVDETWGREIAYENYSRYGAAIQHAVNQWNGLGKVSIFGDSGGSIADLELTDYYDCAASSADAYWQSRWRADLINFNVCKMDSMPDGDFDRRGIAVHEFGHALGIADHYDSWQQWEAIMWWDPKNTPFDSPADHDRNDYHAIWP